MDGMLAQSCRTMGVGVMKSTIEHQMAGIGCIARAAFGNLMVIGYRSGTLMYAIPYMSKHAERTYGKGVMLVSVGEIQNLAVPLSEKLEDSRGRNHHA